MSRYQRRLCGENLYHHIYAWGNDRHSIFMTEHHYKTYLKILETVSKKMEIDIIAYALMEWHIHLFIFDMRDNISKFMEELHGRYATFFNLDTGKVGHVFGERFKNKIVQPNNYGLWLSRYIHRQAVEAGIVTNPEDYPWTSYRQYIGIEPIKFIKPQIILEQFRGNTEDLKEAMENYRQFVTSVETDGKDWDDLKSHIIGNHRYVNEICRKLSVKIKRFVDTDQLLETIASDLNTTKNSLLNPVGIKERKLRHEAINILFKKYNLKINEIAKVLKISRFTVMRQLR
ncbi:MAG: transposase [bacterium]